MIFDHKIVYNNFHNTVDLLKEKLSVIIEDRVEPVVLKTRGKLYQKKNKTDRHAFDVDEKIKRVIREYLND